MYFLTCLLMALELPVHGRSTLTVEHLKPEWIAVLRKQLLSYCFQDSSFLLCFWGLSRAGGLQQAEATELQGSRCVLIGIFSHQQSKLRKYLKKGRSFLLSNRHKSLLNIHHFLRLHNMVVRFLSVGSGAKALCTDHSNHSCWNETW